MMYRMAMAHLEKHLEHLKTEGRGDCWLLSILAGFEVTDPKLVGRINQQQREQICTNRGVAIVTWASDPDSNHGAFFARAVYTSSKRRCGAESELH